MKKKSYILTLIPINTGLKDYAFERTTLKITKEGDVLLRKVTVNLKSWVVAYPHKTTRDVSEEIKVDLWVVRFFQYTGIWFVITTIFSIFDWSYLSIIIHFQRVTQFEAAYINLFCGRNVSIQLIIVCLHTLTCLFDHLVFIHINPWRLFNANPVYT